MSKSRTFPLYIYYFMVDAIEKDEVSLFIRPVFEENIYLDKIYSNIGYPGDTWFVCEAGKMMDDLVFIREDNSCVQNVGGVVVDLSTTYDFNDRDDKNNQVGRFIEPQKMPKWASRYVYEIKKVSYPVLLKDLTLFQIERLGMRIEKNKENGSIFRWGNKIIDTPYMSELRDAFHSIWDESFAIGKPHIRSDSNPYVTIYEVVKI